MCSKRVLSCSTKYTELLNRCPKNQLSYLEIVKLRAQAYIDRINSNPAEPPKINWDYYKANVRKDYVRIVEEFEKQYAEFVVPYPENIYEEELKKLKTEVENELSRFKSESNARIEQYEKQICLILSQITYDQMTMEDYIDAFPDVAPDYRNRPTFWPHSPEEQIETEDKISRTQETLKIPAEPTTLLKSTEVKESTIMVEAKKIKDKFEKGCYGQIV